MVLHYAVVCPHGNGEGRNPNLDAKKGQDFHFDLYQRITVMKALVRGGIYS
jgi:hypothetical protein